MTKDVIKKSLETCADLDLSCEDCPYHHDFVKCSDALKTDARELIIEQENEIERLKGEKKEAQIDVLNKVKDLMDKYYVFEDVSSYFIDDFKELIKEVQNDEDKG